MRKKVSIIGAGQTGASTAQRLVERGYADVVLTDVVEGLAEGKALDLQESAPVVGFALALLRLAQSIYMEVQEFRGEIAGTTRDERRSRPEDG